MGAHAAPCLRAPTPALLLVLLITSSCVFGVSAESESEILLKFKKSLGKETAMSNWNYLTSPCTGDKGNWVGVICFNGSVWGLQLENMGLVGIIDVDSLVSLPYLRTLSFMNNAFNGPMPNVKKLGALKSVFLSNNQFYGEISDDAFAGMGSLKKVYLANNRFSGKIPSSLAALPRLLELRLEKNRFEGQIPDFRQESLQEMNVSDNELEGPIPKGLSKMASSSFSGNQNLCGQPLDSCNSSKMQSGLLIALVVMGIGLILAAVGVVFMIHHRSTQKSRLGRKASLKNPNKSASSHGNQVEHDSRKNRSTKREIESATDFFAESRKIGEGGYGPVYKCYLDHTPVAVKVLRSDAAQGRSQFQQEVEVLSSIRHPNMVLLLGACPEYGCLVYEYLANGSLDDRLFQRGNTPVISWRLRFRIAAEIATGLHFLHQTKPEPLVHRDLKPGNILLDHNYVSKISDVGLARLVPPSVADNVTQYLMTSTAGTFCYIDPEYQQTGMLGIKSDVYSLGIMLLQLITSKPPMGLTHHVAQSIEKGTFNEMLDPAIPDWPVEEALSLAKIALQCAELRRKDRPDLGQVVLPELERLRALAEENMHPIIQSGRSGPTPNHSHTSVVHVSWETHRL
ncbi:hypothetical protein L1049_003918 [Liquidambar formosana]|uniref:RING-type E3 ubiquitin transferase n=1 Tax=Liquidambar formosana TaxID=63359 RepID=A0AAP0RSY6_LIQFO